jgi:dihydropteroate synthase
LGLGAEESKPAFARGQILALKLEHLAGKVAQALSEKMTSLGASSVQEEKEGETDGYSIILLGTPLQFDTLAHEAASFLPHLANIAQKTIENYQRNSFAISHPGGKLSLEEHTALMGVLNVTPDSFSDGGKFFTAQEALSHAEKMIDAGADIIDIGGESTRPGADPVSLDEELRRIIPVIKQLAENSRVLISVDTYKARVAEEALAAGAGMINDISGLRADPEMPGLAARSGVPLVTMHIQGRPKDMQTNPHYDDLMSEIALFLREGIGMALEAGVDEEKIIIDPGIGFGKTLEHNLEIIDRLWELKSLGRPILIGTSRKSFIGKVLDRPVEDRLWGTAATVALSIAHGAKIVRVHDVHQMHQVVRMSDAVLRGKELGNPE